MIQITVSEYERLHFISAHHNGRMSIEDAHRFGWQTFERDMQDYRERGLVIRVRDGVYHLFVNIDDHETVEIVSE